MRLELIIFLVAENIAESDTIDASVQRSFDSIPIATAYDAQYLSKIEQLIFMKYYEYVFVCTRFQHVLCKVIVCSNERAWTQLIY